ncbi:MAG: response regulator [Betaproteobacteria bacterium]|nr:response regulator [Betaproteobacteria bacterium]
MASYQAGATADKSVPHAGANANASMPMRILIVDDEHVLAKNLETYLSRSALEVRTVGNGEEAIEMLESFTPDALILDYGLPGINGLQTYAEIVRRRAGRIDCVMITGNASEELALDAHEKGIRHLICKPFSFSELQRLLEVPVPGRDSDPPGPE